MRANYVAIFYPQHETVGDLNKPRQDIRKIYKHMKKEAKQAGLIVCDDNGKVLLVKPFKTKNR